MQLTHISKSLYKMNRIHYDIEYTYCITKLRIVRIMSLVSLAIPRNISRIWRGLS